MYLRLTPTYNVTSTWAVQLPLRLVGIMVDLHACGTRGLPREEHARTLDGYVYLHFLLIHAEILQNYCLFYFYYFPCLEGLKRGLLNGLGFFIRCALPLREIRGSRVFVYDLIWEICRLWFRARCGGHATRWPKSNSGTHLAWWLTRGDKPQLSYPDYSRSTK